MSETIPSDRFVVETPENIRFGYDIADIGSRFLAVLIDTLIQGVLYVILFFTMAVLVSQLTRLDLPDWLNDAFGIFAVVALFLIQFGYFMFFEIILNGQTPGKRLFGLRVIKDNGYPLSPLDSVIRNLVRIIDFFPFAYGIGLVTMFSNARAKRLGDFAAGTIVVKMRQQVRLQDLKPVTPAPGPTPQTSIHPPAGLTRLEESDIALIESFLGRRATLQNGDALARQLAQQMALKMDPAARATPKTTEQADTFLRELVTAYRRERA